MTLGVGAGVAVTVGTGGVVGSGVGGAGVGSGVAVGGSGTGVGVDANETISGDWAHATVRHITNSKNTAKDEFLGHIDVSQTVIRGL